MRGGRPAGCAGGMGRGRRPGNGRGPAGTVDAGVAWIGGGRP